MTCWIFCQRQNRYQLRMQRSEIRGKISTTDPKSAKSTIGNYLLPINQSHIYFKSYSISYSSKNLMYSYVKIVQYRSCLWHSINILNRFRYPESYSGLLLALPLARVLQSSQVFFYTKQQSVNFPISSVYPLGGEPGIWNSLLTVGLVLNPRNDLLKLLPKAKPVLAPNAAQRNSG